MLKLMRINAHYIAYNRKFASLNMKCRMNFIVRDW